MKFPFDFSLKLIFRLVLPGFLLSLGFFPLMNVVLRLNGWESRAEYVFVMLVVLLGWAITISDMRIYMLFEGRRYWPGFLKTFMKGREQKRLARLQVNKGNKDKSISAEAYVDLRNFPMPTDAGGEYQVLMPSRLGNLLYAFEGYSRRLYGVDAIFYWPRIWLKLDKETREEIDNSQALADSTLYAAFAFLLAGALWLLYALAKFVIVIALARDLGPRLQYDLTLIDKHLPPKATAVLVAVLFAVASFLIYRLSLPLHAQFGELFKSVFDTYVVDVSNVTKDLVRLSEGSPAVSLSKVLLREDQMPIAARYLQYYRYRCPACNDLLKPSEIKTHVCRRSGWPFDPPPVGPPG
jgi:hypothetical protein